MITNNHPDLDMSDVLADADNMFDQYLQSLYMKDEVELMRVRYIYGPGARRGEYHDRIILEHIDYIRSQISQDQVDDTLGSCGCTDYHMADCPLMTSRFDAGSDAEFDFYYDLDEA